jgi:hypothetical protein
MSSPAQQVDTPSPAKKPKISPKLTAARYETYPLYEHDFTRPFDFNSLPRRGAKYSDELLGYLLALRAMNKVTRQKLLSLEVFSSEAHIYPGCYGYGNPCLDSEGQVLQMKIRAGTQIVLGGEYDSRGNGPHSSYNVGIFVINPAQLDPPNKMPFLEEWLAAFRRGFTFVYKSPATIGPALIRIAKPESILYQPAIHQQAAFSSPVEASSSRATTSYVTTPVPDTHARWLQTATSDPAKIKKLQDELDALKVKVHEHELAARTHAERAAEAESHVNTLATILDSYNQQLITQATHHTQRFTTYARNACRLANFDTTTLVFVRDQFQKAADELDQYNDDVENDVADNTLESI